jgi:hypothetical protein
VTQDNFAENGVCLWPIAKTREGAGAHADVGPQPDIRALNSLAARSLALLFDEEEKLFCRRLVLTTDGIRREEVSPRRTVIALLGLQRLSESGERQPFDLASIRNALLDDRSWVRGAGDLGLLIWLTAVCDPERLAVLLHELEIEDALAAWSNGRPLATRSLAWLLAGIAHARLAGCGKVPDLTDAAVEIYRMLQENQSEGGLFGHTAGFWRRALSNRFGTFSDEMHAIYALSTFGRAFHIEEPVGSALDCAGSVLSLQGEMGQWWFLYDKHACRVVNRYPMLAVHQYGTAPAALLALGEVTGRDFRKPIEKGLSWIAGANELGDDPPNPDRTALWESIDRKSRVAKCWEAALSFLNISRQARPGSLRIRYEARPDHLGWLLYAFGKSGLPPGGQCPQSRGSAV